MEIGSRTGGAEPQSSTSHRKSRDARYRLQAHTLADEHFDAVGCEGQRPSATGMRIPARPELFALLLGCATSRRSRASSVPRAEPTAAMALKPH